MKEILVETSARHIHLNEEQFKILFPYRMTYEEKLVGGVQFTSIDEGIISIGGYCECM